MGQILEAFNISENAQVCKDMLQIYASGAANMLKQSFKKKAGKPSGPAVNFGLIFLKALMTSFSVISDVAILILSVMSAEQFILRLEGMNERN